MTRILDRCTVAIYLGVKSLGLSLGQSGTFALIITLQLYTPNS